MKTNFYSWLKSQTDKIPPSELDKNILFYSSQFFAEKAAKEKTSFIHWKISGIAALASIALVLILINREGTPQPASTMITESPEMILNYNEIELMADAGALSEADWAKINGAK